MPRRSWAWPGRAAVPRRGRRAWPRGGGRCRAPVPHAPRQAGAGGRGSWRNFNHLFGVCAARVFPAWCVRGPMQPLLVPAFKFSWDDTTMLRPWFTGSKLKMYYKI